MDNANRISLTPTVARQTPKNEFGAVLKQALERGAAVAGSLLSAVPGGGVISTAIRDVTALASQGRGVSSSAGLAATGVVTVGSVGPTTAGGGGTLVGQLATASGDVGSGLGDYVGEMRKEADRSMMMQMQLQRESREYNTLSNVLKVRHDSAKAAINNVR